MAKGRRASHADVVALQVCCVRMYIALAALYVIRAQTSRNHFRLIVAQAATRQPQLCRGRTLPTPQCVE